MRILVGQGTWGIDQVAEALEAKDRAALGLNAPPEGLYFLEAVYGKKRGQEKEKIARQERLRRSGSHEV